MGIRVFNGCLPRMAATRGAGARLLYKFLAFSIRDNMTRKMSQPIPFSIRVCSDHAAYEAWIQHKISFDMVDIERLLTSVKENEIIANTPHIIIFRSKNAEVTLSRTGRMLIKKVRNENEARAVAGAVLRVVSDALL